jgi:hypothetical protein
MGWILALCRLPLAFTTWRDGFDRALEKINDGRFCAKERHFSTMKNFLMILAVVMLIVVAIPFAVNVWPTQCRYDHIKLGASEFPVRIDRSTGQAELLNQAGWQPMRPATTPQVDAFGRPVFCA